MLLSDTISQLVVEDDETTTTTTTGEDDLNEVDEIIMNASKELEKTAEKNEQLLKFLEKNPEQEEDEYEKDVLSRLEQAEQNAKETANEIYKLKTRVGELLKKEELSDIETRELDTKNNELKKQMKLFEERTKLIKFLIEKTNFMSQINDERSGGTPPKNFESESEKIGKIGYCSSCFQSVRRSSSIPSIAKKLSQSYTMQEKLAEENSNLENVRFKLQEELLSKDQTLECLQREVGALQNQMKVLTRENKALHEKLRKMENNEIREFSNIQKPHMSSKKLQEYSDNTYELEKQLQDMENDVKCLHEEICAVQREREHLEKHRKMMVTPKSHFLPDFNSSTFHPPYFHSQNRISPQLIKEIIGKDLNSKITSISTLKNDYEKLKKLTKEAEELKKNTKEKIEECEKKIKSENEISPERERQLQDAKTRLKNAQEKLKEEQKIIIEQNKLVEDVTSKYLEARQQLDEQKCHFGVKFDNSNFGAQIVSNLHDKLEEIST